MSSPKVSVIINSYNYEGYVGQAIESALAQKEADVEVVVVDDGSTDGTAAVIRGFGDRVRGVFQENGGQACAINAGARASRGEILCFLDADDWWAEDKIRTVVSAFDADPDVQLVYHRLQPVHADGRAFIKPIPRTLCSGKLDRRLARSGGCWPYPMTSSLAVRRFAWERAGAIPAEFRISADAWLVGVYPFLGRVAALPSALGFYRIHGHNNWTNLAEDIAYQRRRVAHWEMSVDKINQFLRREGRDARLSLSDHFPYQVALATLEGADFGRRISLLAEGLSFAGEPNFLRRARDTLRAVTRIPQKKVKCTPAKVKP